MTSVPTATRDRSFAEALVRLSEAHGRQRLAILRRTLGGRAGALDGVRVLAMVVPPGASDHDAVAYELVAGLYAAYHRGRAAPETSAGDLGASFARLAHARDEGGEGAVGRRFAQLLATDRADLGDRLRRAVTLLRSAGVGIDWAILAGDVRAWDGPERPIQRRWARSFVAGVTAADLEEPADASAPDAERGEHQ
jgi:CRISPR type I-E-associated protein CasB/Cse2